MSDKLKKTVEVLASGMPINKLKNKDNTMKIENLEMYKAAEELTQKQISIIPLCKAYSCPKIHWKKYQSTIADNKKLWHWFFEGSNRVAGIAGKFSGTLIVDCESQELYEHLCSKYDIPAKTPRVKTQNGCHLFFKYDPSHGEIKIRATNRVGIDIIGQGKYHLLPPSIVNNWNVVHKCMLDHQYIWEVEFDRANLQPIPDDLIKDLKMIAEKSH